MNRNPLTPVQRHEAWSRLRTMTTGVAVVGIAATAGIGAVAATHHPGKAAATSVAQDNSAGDDGAAAPDVNAGPDATDAPAVAPDQGLPALGAPATAAPGRVQAPVIKPRVRASTKAHVSSGGS